MAAEKPGDGERAGEPRVTLYTVSNRRFFLGTVALLNSLRISGNNWPMVVLDAGLEPGQAQRLQRHANVTPQPSTRLPPNLLKAFPTSIDPGGVAILIDSDMMVVGSLDETIALALSGKICVFPDHHSQADRWFEEWASVLHLRAPLRKDAYVNSGFVAVSVDSWPWVLPRFSELCTQAYLDGVITPERASTIFSDQDILNALLMSEVPRDAVQVMPYSLESYPDALRQTRVVSPRTLECRTNTARPLILHESMTPKVWADRGWLRLRRDAYVELFARVTSAEDVPLRLHPDELPFWLRARPFSMATRLAVDWIQGMGSFVWHRLPPSAARAVVRARGSLARPRSERG